MLLNFKWWEIDYYHKNRYKFYRLFKHYHIEYSIWMIQWMNERKIVRWIVQTKNKNIFYIYYTNIKNNAIRLARKISKIIENKQIFKYDKCVTNYEN